jgi:hypothetical protein
MAFTSKSERVLDFGLPSSRLSNLMEKHNNGTAIPKNPVENGGAVL